MITGMFVGFSGVFAEPDLKEIIGEQSFGDFKPNYLVEESDDSFAPVAWIETRIIGIQADMWERGRIDKETGDPVKQEIINNVYTYEGIETKMFTGRIQSPILQPVNENKEPNYYVVTYDELKRINGAQAYFYVGPNSEDGVLLDSKSYFYDENTGYLYIEKSILENKIKDSVLMPIRAESTFVFHDIETVSKNVTLKTFFARDVELPDDYLVGTANREQPITIRESQMGDIEIQFVSSDRLAYFSKENLSVYINGMPFDAWNYNENTGYIKLSANILSINSIMVEVKALNDVSDQQTLLQQQQSSDILAPSADGLEDVVRDYNEYIEYLQYDNDLPVVGTYQRMDYVARIMLGISMNGSAQTPEVIEVKSHNPFPAAALSILTEKAADNDWVNSYLLSSTWSTQAQIQDNNTKLMNKVTRPSTVPKLPDDMWETSSQIYGEIAYYLWKAQDSNTTDQGREDSISYVNALANAYLFNFSGTAVPNNYVNDSGAPLKMQWPSDRLIDNRWHTHTGLGQSRFVCGIFQKTGTFLGGEIHGNVLIDGDCCNIVASANWAQDVNGAFGGVGTQTDYQCGTSIIAMRQDSENAGYGDLWTCMWSRSLQSVTTIGEHAQRIQSYSKIRYKWRGEGTLRFEKLNEYGAKIAGAIYEIRDENGDVVQTITTSKDAAVEIKLTKGSYTVKEKTPPSGYLKDKATHSFSIGVDEITDVVVRDEFQLCHVTFTVYDKTTKGNAREVGIPGIQFALVDGNSTPVTFRNADGLPMAEQVLTTDAAGQIDFYVRTLDVTPGIAVVGQPPQLYLQQLNTVKNYRKTTEPADEDYCEKILISDFDAKNGVCPTISGENTTYSEAHYENRQWVTIRSHVQDASLGANTTMSHLGGYAHSDGSTQTNLVGVKYYIMTKNEKVLLGYTDNGTPVYLKPKTILGFAENGAQGGTANRPTEIVSYSGDPNQPAYIEITSQLNSTMDHVTKGLSLNPIDIVVGEGNTSFYDFAWSTRDQQSGVGIHDKILHNNFELPNGTYQLILDKPSSGYHRWENEQDKADSTYGVHEGEGINNKNITNINAEWINDPTSYKKPILYVDTTPVVLERQTVSLDVYVKSYIAEDKSVSPIQKGNLVSKDFHGMALGITDSTVGKDGVHYYDSLYNSLHELPVINQNNKKETRTSNDNGRISTSSNEYVSITRRTTGNAFAGVLSVETLPNAESTVDFENVIIELYNLTTIVDIKTGKVIPALNSKNGKTSEITPLGRYRVDENGYVKIDKMGSAAIDNPFPNETDGLNHIPSVAPTNVDNEEVWNELPNGVYYLRIYQQDKGTQGEWGLTENIIFDTAWNDTAYTKTHVDRDSLHLIQDGTRDDGVYEIHIAPDLPVSTNNSLRYDPNDVVGTSNKILIGDENNIANVLPSTQDDSVFDRALAWIDKHANDFSYRIYEMINNDGSDYIADDHNVNTDVVDNLPTTFAMYIDHDIMAEDNVEYHYYTRYYYQITKSEYDAATQEEKTAQIVTKIDGIYYRKFTSNELLNIVTLNSNSAGYIRYIEGGYEIDANKPVMGAIYNIKWINDRMAKASTDGTYHILVSIEVEKTTTNWFTGEKRVDVLNTDEGTLRIKNRHLFDLD